MNGAQNRIIHRRLDPPNYASGQAFFKWLAILALLATAACGYFLFTGNQSQQAALAQARAEGQQELAKQTEELERLRSENKEIERLRAGSQEVVKLRADSAQLRVLQKEQQKIQ